MYQLTVTRMIDSSEVIKIVDSEAKLKKEFEHYEKEFMHDNKLKGQYKVLLEKYVI